ncbi:MAG: Dipeptidyl aminopeptidase BIII [Candidatus Anoxychlamydiales bacterium]|nr:Dipeptidyl aminopeptidase BIII [Candidatus Anoxychlamydiales bacterium]
MKIFIKILLILTVCRAMAIDENYGSWISPITSNSIVEKTIKFANIYVDGNDLYLSEMRPSEKGRSTILKYNGKTFEEVLDKQFHAKTKVHEYGGLSFAAKDGEIYFSNFEDQRIYKINKKGKISPITPVSTDRYANFIIDKKRELIFCVEEEHLENEVNNSIVKIDENGKVTKIATGFDFYSSLTISDDNKKLAFLAWNQPDMPWDAAELWESDIEDNGDLKNLKRVAGSETEAIFQPRFSKDGSLYFVSDRTNFWNLYKYKDDEIESIYPMDAEFGLPLWVFGMSTYDFFYKDGKTYIVACYTKNSKDNLAIIDVENKTLEKVDSRYSYFTNIATLDEKVFFFGASPLDVTSVVSLDLKTKKSEILKKSRDLQIDLRYISEPEFIEFETQNQHVSYMIYYPPTNKDYISKKGERPPLIVQSHGGPTSQAVGVLKLEIQYWTSRGFGFVDVNYAGSTGYGREFRQKLYGNWGIYDVDDCVDAAQYLVKKGKADENRLIIRGGSAGGYTTLAALTFRDVFHAGASYFGISDIIALVEDTHKFEAKYEDKLVGPYPETKQLYFERSPINFTEQLSCPIILFQGEDDKIVPPNQAEKMYKALNEKKLPTAYLLFENEGHGFRNAKAIKKAIESELYFYSRIFGFEIKDDIEPIKIQNLKI